MRALVVEGEGGLDQLRVRDDLPAPPPPGPGEVRLRMLAAALNHLDLFVAQGTLKGLTFTWPHIVGTDGCGVVESTGADVVHVRPGDRVLVNPSLWCGTCWACQRGEESLCERFGVIGEHRAGLAAELVTLPAVNVAPVPEGMPVPQAAALALATTTAWHMMVARAAVRREEAVLVWGVGGGVAQAAVQIGALLGARVIATSSDRSKLALALDLGAAHVVHHGEQDVVAEARRLTEGRGVDVVVDSVGEATWPRSLRALRRGGRLVTCGATTGPDVALDIRKLFWHQWSLLGSTMGSRRDFGEVVRQAGLGHLWPVVDRVVPLAEGPAAFRRMAAGEQAGKLVIEVTS